MTTEEKARAYDEAIERAKEVIRKMNMYDGTCIKEDIEDIFPQLAESEDERIRMKLFHTVRGTPKDNEWFEEISKEAMLAWLEKQKEPHYTKRNELFDRCVENCDPKTVEEVNKRVDDIMNMPELSAFEQALTNFIGYWEDDEERWPSKFVKKHGKHILDMAREELQKEQKPAQTFEEKEYIRTIKSLISDFIRDKQPEDVAFYQKIYDWLDGRHIEQKPAEWKPQPESLEALMYAIEGKWNMIPPTSYLSRRLEDLYEGLVNTFNVNETLLAELPKTAYTAEDIEELRELKHKIEASMEQKPADGKEYSSPECGTTAGMWSEAKINGEPVSTENQTVDIPLAKWSEEDEDRYNSTIEVLQIAEANNGYNHYGRQEIIKDIDWLKSLRPSWKPTYEQMEALRKAVNKLADTEVADSVRLSIMYDHLKKLI